MSLVAETLAIRRGGRTLLAALSFRVEPGGVLLLRGPNGAGKTTLLRALAGLVPLAAGRVTLDGIDLARDPAAVQERIGWAGHLDAVKPQLAAGENLGAWAGILGGTPGPALERFGLAALADRPAAFLSAGQRRRLGLARLLLAPRRLWLLDEPTVALDSEAAAVLAAAVRDHARAGGMAVIATHAPLDLPGAATLALGGEAAGGPGTADAGPARAGAARPAPGAGAAEDPFLAGDWR